jgi:hypothetical protein
MDKDDLVLTTMEKCRFRNWIVELFYQSRDVLEFTLKILGICILSSLFTYSISILYFKYFKLILS